MNSCPYRVQQSSCCKIVSPWEYESAGLYPVCKSTQWSDCPHFRALCREAEQAAAEVYARQAANSFLEHLQGVSV